jgi:hypothetical protein
MFKTGRISKKKYFLDFDWNIRASRSRLIFANYPTLIIEMLFNMDNIGSNLSFKHDLGNLRRQIK